MADRNEKAPPFWVNIDSNKEKKEFQNLSIEEQKKKHAPGWMKIIDNFKEKDTFALFDQHFYPVNHEEEFSRDMHAFMQDYVQTCDTVDNVLQKFKWIKDKEDEFFDTNKAGVQMRWITEGGVKKMQRKGTSDELMEEFNKQIRLEKPHYQQLAQESRMLDKSAAMLIAGAACVSVRGNVWVDCNMESEWFDSSDEKNLMRFAWADVIGKDTATSAENFARMSGNTPAQLADDHDPRLTYITTVLKSFRKTQLTMQLYSLSPGAEASLSTLVIDAMEQCPQLSAFGDSSESRHEDRSTVSEHDDKIRRMARILRRIPFTRNEFCRVAGNMLRYNISLQEGVAISTRRLNQIQVDMRHAVGVWLQFLNGNIERILHEVMHCYYNDESFYVFDWTTHRLKILDSEQYGVDVPSFNVTVEDEVMYQQSCGDRTCKWENNPPNNKEDTSAYGKIPRTKQQWRTVSPYVNN